MVFANRQHAATRLAEALSAYKGRNPLILAIPRGAVAMGQHLARELGGELDVVLVRKLRAPFNPEFALGSVDESGWTYVADYAESAGGTASYLEQEKQAQLDTIRARRAQYTPLRPPIDPASRIVIVVDDEGTRRAIRASASRPSWSSRASSTSRPSCRASTIRPLRLRSWVPSRLRSPPVRPWGRNEKRLPVVPPANSREKLRESVLVAEKASFEVVSIRTKTESPFARPFPDRYPLKPGEVRFSAGAARTVAARKRMARARFT